MSSLNCLASAVLSSSPNFIIKDTLTKCTPKPFHSKSFPVWCSFQLLLFFFFFLLLEHFSKSSSFSHHCFQSRKISHAAFQYQLCFCQTQSSTSHMYHFCSGTLEAHYESLWMESNMKATAQLPAHYNAESFQGHLTPLPLLPAANLFFHWHR